MFQALAGEGARSTCEAIWPASKMTCQLLSGGVLTLNTNSFDNALQLREAVSESMRCSASAVKLIQKDGLLEDSFSLEGQDVSEVSVVLNDKWTQLRLLQVVTQKFETFLDEISSVRTSRMRVMQPSFQAAAPAFSGMTPFEIDDGRGGEWTIASSSTRAEPVDSMLDSFRESLQELLEQCDASLLPCWGGGDSCYMHCSSCGPCATKLSGQPGWEERQSKPDAWNGKPHTEAFQSGMGEEFRTAFEKFYRTVFGCHQTNFSWYNHYGDHSQGATICVPCKLRHVLPQLSSVKAAEGIGRSKPIVCVAAPLSIFPCCSCDMDELVFGGYAGDWYCDCPACCPTPYQPSEQPNSWRREVREWQREVKAKKRIHDRACGLERFLEGKRAKRRNSKYHRLLRPRGGRHKDGEQATRLGLD